MRVLAHLIFASIHEAGTVIFPHFQFNPQRQREVRRLAKLMRGRNAENPAVGGRAWLAPSIKLATCLAHCLARAHSPWDPIIIIAVIEGLARAEGGARGLASRCPPSAHRSVRGPMSWQFLEPSGQPLPSGCIPLRGRRGGLPPAPAFRHPPALPSRCTDRFCRVLGLGV